MKRPTFVLIASVVVTLAVVIYFLAVEPANWVQEKKWAFISVRSIAALIALIFSVVSFTGGRIFKGVKELKLEKSYLLSKDNSDLKAAGYNKFDIWFIAAPMWAWVIWWIVCFQIMVSFYVNDWCKYGF